jgi:hypothetical protein
VTRVVENYEQAEKTYEVFYDRPHNRQIDLGFSWPKRMQEIGHGTAELYRSNKWKKNHRDFDEYKHVVEGSRTMLVTPGFIRDWKHPSRQLPVAGPTVELLGPLPKHVTRLGHLLGLQCRLYERMDGDEPVFGKNGWYEMRVAHAYLAAATHPETKEIFLCVYNADGVHVLLTGGQLTIEKDGIAG